MDDDPQKKYDMSALELLIRLDRRWILVPRYPRFSTPSIKELLRLLRPEKVLCQRLLPRTAEAARPNSLSSRYGLDAFPFHTDFATAEIPPRLILLAATRPRRAKTLLFDTDGLIENFGYEHLKRCIFLQKDRKSRYCRLLTTSNGKLRFIYNHDIMIPYNSEAREVENYITSGIGRVHSIDWSECRFALIDNWNVFHAREACKAKDSVGLLRFAIWGDFHDVDV